MHAGRQYAKRGEGLTLIPRLQLAVAPACLQGGLIARPILGMQQLRVCTRPGQSPQACCQAGCMLPWHNTGLLMIPNTTTAYQQQGCTCEPAGRPGSAPTPGGAAAVRLHETWPEPASRLPGWPHAAQALWEAGTPPLAPARQDCGPQESSCSRLAEHTLSCKVALCSSQGNKKQAA